MSNSEAGNKEETKENWINIYLVVLGFFAFFSALMYIFSKVTS